MLRPSPILTISSKTPVQAMTGFALLETSIALFLLAATVLVLGDFWLKGTQIREQVLAQNALIQMRSILSANPLAAEEGAYLTEGRVVSVGAMIPACSSWCSSSQLAQTQVLRWQAQLASQLPKGRGDIARTTNGLRIAVRWYSPATTVSTIASDCPDLATGFLCVATDWSTS